MRKGDGTLILIIVVILGFTVLNWEKPDVIAKFIGPLAAALLFYVGADTIVKKMRGQ